jgi:hypothetical protein
VAPSLTTSPPGNRFAFSRTTAADDDGSNAIRAISNVASALGQRTHLAGVSDAATGQMMLHVNGAAQSTTAATGGWNASGGYVIGRARWAGAATNLGHGGIDDVRIYPKAPTATMSPRPASATTTFSVAAPSGMSCSMAGYAFAGLPNRSRQISTRTTRWRGGGARVSWRRSIWSEQV